MKKVTAASSSVFCVALLPADDDAVVVLLSLLLLCCCWWWWYHTACDSCQKVGWRAACVDQSFVRCINVCGLVSVASSYAALSFFLYAFFNVSVRD